MRISIEKTETMALNVDAPVLVKVNGQAVARQTALPTSAASSHRRSIQRKTGKARSAFKGMTVTSGDRDSIVQTQS